MSERIRMSVNHYVYVGTYMKLWRPKENVIQRDKVCPVCHKKVVTDFCPRDGVKSLPYEAEESINFYELVESCFGKEDVLSLVNNDEIVRRQYDIVVGNQDKQGFLIISKDSDEENHLPSQEVTEDWLRFGEFLKTRNIRYEMCFGIVTYYH